MRTEGEWRVGDAGHTVFGPPNGKPAPEIIASVRKKDNARFIAAAPEMLLELKRARTVITAYCAMHKRTSRAECCVTLEAIDSLITKAEGKVQA